MTARPASGPRTATLNRGPALMIVLLLVAMAGVRYAPFDWDPPRWVTNEVVATQEGGLRFGLHNRARTEETPVWVDEARTAGLQVRLVVRPADRQSEPEAAVMLLARDYWRTSFAVVQRDADLMLWLRRPGASIGGDPPFVVEDVFRGGRRTTLSVSIADELRIAVDGRLRLVEALPPNALQDWGDGLLALGDEIRGGVPWQGTIHQAEVRTKTSHVDYVRPGTLTIPSRYFHFPQKTAAFPPSSGLEWWILLGHLLSFVAVGFLLARLTRPPPRPSAAVALAVGLSLLLAAGKLFFSGRHLSPADIVVQSAGAVLGVWVALRLSGRRIRIGRWAG